MRKDVGCEFTDCHSCGYMMDVSKQVLIFNSDPNKQIIKKVCDECGCMNQLVIDMVYGLTSIEKVNKRKKEKRRT